jgi:hypothetical protein
VRVAIRLLFKIVALWVILCLERVIGIPVLFIVLSCLWARQFGVVGQYVWLCLSSLMLMSMFELSWVVIFLMLASCVLWLRWGRMVLASDTMRLLIAVLAASVTVTWLAPGTMAGSGWIYVGVVLGGLLLSLKKERLGFSQDWRKVRE